MCSNNPLSSNYGYGIFSIQTGNIITNSTWIMDDSNQLLIVTGNNFYIYFNSTGFFMYDAISKTCSWVPTCNYQCEVYNYNSRFLDYSGEWIILKKWGITQMQPLTVEAWIGNAIDAAGVFPIIMYIDKKTDHYIGLDKLDTIGSRATRATYWYTEHGNTISRTSIANFHPNVVEVGCTTILNEWSGFRTNSGVYSQSNYMPLLFFLYLFMFHIFE